MTPLRYTRDLINNYQSLSDLPGFVLLESSDHKRGRYDIVSALPYDELKLFRHSSSILDVFQQLQARLPAVSSRSSDIPFQGGGYWLYRL